MQRNGSPATLLCDLVLKLDSAADFAARVEHHIPGQFGYLCSAKTGLNRKQNDQTVA
ncbi:hypothetical protein BBta_1229 [Bradyrhizobium sp. BTAi1]|nr:hypothetical protein BBta_1229 [Bradyrhizobium sp. BTAi1]